MAQYLVKHRDNFNFTLHNSCRLFQIKLRYNRDKNYGKDKAVSALRYSVMKMYEGMKLRPHAFLTEVLLRVSG
jgi:hypothetical protein